MESLIPIVNKIQDAFTSLGINVQIDLPQIAVVGGQSAGKSSVLENFVGKDFLPRGSGIVTRRPLILQLINSSQEYGEFLHNRGNKYTDFERIRLEIETETNRVTGKNKGISNIPINLRIYSPSVLNLTLIDLPGLTKVAVGDQPENIEAQIRSLILQYIQNETCLILAVTPANVDISTSDALKLAQQVDPFGLRTIGVLTKLDIMDEGTDARNILENKVVPLKHGYIGVVSRSQKAIEENKNIQEAIKDEALFFQNHPRYKDLSEKLGTRYLQQTLSNLLAMHIRDNIPYLKDRLQNQIMSLEKEVDQYKHFRPDDPTLKAKIMLQLIQRFQNEFQRAIEGSGSSAINTTELSSGARINKIFHERLHSDILRISSNEKELRKAISMAIQNTHGVRVGLFTPDMAFETIAKTQIATLKEPLVKCVDYVIDELSSSVRSLSESMSYFPKLQEETTALILNHIRDQEQICKYQVQLIIDFELAYMNTNHEDFVGFANEQNEFEQVSKKLGNQIIRKGMLTMQNLGIIKGVSKNFWFVLTSDCLTWYRDDDEKETKFILVLEGLRIKDVYQGFLFRKYSFSLFFPDGRNVFKDFKTLELGCDTEEELELWKESFLRAGVYPEEEECSGVLKEIKKPQQNQLDRQIETIRNLVDSYMKIVIKTARDLAPKAVMKLIINSTTDFINNELMSYLCSHYKQEELMVESNEGAQRRESVMQLYQGCKEALKIITDVSLTLVAGGSSLTSRSMPILSNKLAMTKADSHETSDVNNEMRMMPSKDFQCNSVNNVSFQQHPKPKIASKIHDLFVTANHHSARSSRSLPKSLKCGFNKIVGKSKFKI